MIKLNDSFSGEGNALVSVPARRRAAGELRRAVDHAEMPVPTETPDRYFDKFERMGGIVEEFIEARREELAERAVSHQPDRRGAGDLDARSDPRRRVGPDLPGLQLSRARRVPRPDSRRRAPRRARCWRGTAWSAATAWTSWPGATPATTDWHITALEINLRVLGTTHPFLALRFLTGGELDTATGQFLSLSGRPKYYRATDNLRSKTYRGLLPEDLFDIVSMNGLHYSHRTESGVLFHMIGAVSEFGKLGRDGDRQRRRGGRATLRTCHRRPRRRVRDRTNTIRNSEFGIRSSELVRSSEFGIRKYFGLQDRSSAEPKWRATRASELGGSRSSHAFSERTGPAPGSAYDTPCS